MREITPVVKQLLIINIIFFAGSQFVLIANELFSLHYPASNGFRFWQILTHMFMHGGISHLVFNMFALYSFGSTLEHFWGGKKFLFFYISCGLGAALLQLGVNYYEISSVLNNVSDLNFSEETLNQILNAKATDGQYFRADLFLNNITPILESSNKANLINEANFMNLFKAASINQSTMVGASGAIYGLLVAFAFMFPNAELALMFIPVPIKAKYFVPLWMFLFDGFFGIFGKSLVGINTGIAHFAHIGGALIGFIMMWYWKKNSYNDRRWH